MRLQETYNRYGDKFSNKDELERNVRRYMAGVGGGHQTGGAVDLTLCDNNGLPLDMGSEYPIKCPELVTSYALSPIISERRRLLCKVMNKEGFVKLSWGMVAFFVRRPTMGCIPQQTLCYIWFNR